MKRIRHMKARLFVVLALMLVAGGQLTAQLGVSLTKVEQAATPGDEVIIGAEQDYVVLLTHPASAPVDWKGAELRMAQLNETPWSVTLPEVWGHTPQRREAWSSLGDIVHIDIDPASDMAVLSHLVDGAGQIKLSGKTGQQNGTWGQPWEVPALANFSGTCAFAVFDQHPGREGDVLVALRPRMKGTPESLIPTEGNWKGGYDIARIPRRGGYAQVLLLDGINSAANEMALVPGPQGGGWLSTQRLGGSGGLDPWWATVIPQGGEAGPFLPDSTMWGHTLVVRCEGFVLQGLAWQVKSEGLPVMRLTSDAQGRVDLGDLKSDRTYTFDLQGDPPGDCPEAFAEWRDGEGQLLRRVRLAGKSWSLSLLTAMPLGGWRAIRDDRSRLPEDAEVPVIKVEPKDPDWVVFHDLGALALSKTDRDRIRQLAQRVKERPQDVIYIRGHASIDGDPGLNAVLADERARHVAAQLEFAGLDAGQIRFKGLGTAIPLVQCPPGIHCPAGTLERSRRTELYIEVAKGSDGGTMQ